MPRLSHLSASALTLYIACSLKFRFQYIDLLPRLSKNAKDGKLEGSALSWLEATMQCIECHKWTRANLIADKP